MDVVFILLHGNGHYQHAGILQFGVGASDQISGFLLVLDQVAQYHEIIVPIGVSEFVKSDIVQSDGIHDLMHLSGDVDEEDALRMLSVMIQGADVLHCGPVPLERTAHGAFCIVAEVDSGGFEAGEMAHADGTDDSVPSERR